MRPDDPRARRRMLVARGLPEPVLHHELVAGGRVVARFDFAWPAWRIAVNEDDVAVGCRTVAADIARASAA